MQLLIFDLDGTLIDSRQDIILSVNRVFLQLGFSSQPGEVISKEIGRGSEYLFTRLLTGILGSGATPELIRDAVASFKKVYQQHLLDHTVVYPGIIDAVLYYSKLPKVIVTNKSQVLADLVVEGLGLKKHFEGVFGAEAFTTRKPDAGPVLEVCKKWNVNPSDAVMIGDSQFDIVAGRTAGTMTVGVLYGYGHLDFQIHPPHLQIETATQLIGLFS